MKDKAEEIAEKYIQDYHDVVDHINDYTDKRIPITQEMDDMRNDLSRLFMAIVGNPNSKDGSWKHGRPMIYDMMQSYHKEQSKEEAKESKWISVDGVENIPDGDWLVLLEKEMLGRTIHSASIDNKMRVSTVGRLFVWEAPKIIGYMPLPDPPR